MTTQSINDFETISRRAISVLLERGQMLLDVGRLEPTDPVEQAALALARLGKDGRRRGGLEIDSRPVSLRFFGSRWWATVGARSLDFRTRRHALLWLLPNACPGLPIERVSVLADAFDADELAMSVGELRARIGGAA